MNMLIQVVIRSDLLMENLRHYYWSEIYDISGTVDAVVIRSSLRKSDKKSESMRLIKVIWIMPIMW